MANTIKEIKKKPKKFTINNKNFYNRFAHIPKVVSASGGFYNPSEEDYGKFYIDYQGIPSSTIIKYEGNINIKINNSLNEKILIKNVRETKTIIILNINAVAFDETLLFEYSGTIEKIKSAIISGFQTKEIMPSIVEYDLTNVPANKSETKPEDDSILLVDIEVDEEQASKLPKLSNYSNLEKLKISKKLPPSYTGNVVNLIQPENLNDMTMEDRINCSTCFYFKKNYCNLWDAIVRPLGWCESWKAINNQVGRQEEINEL